ncbi:glyoxal oxidase [Jaapia argillacea MUCL 33604]|uniref:Glyoxal oxidase n=1 Tax=Jaapia argillacea MUCL 33604 TaxID=933084 RepID=A0A067QBQ8_9AGAM|nr:glyoxal oxidase [Jaapia argillacea MUCL 33604]
MTVIGIRSIFRLVALAATCFVSANSTESAWNGFSTHDASTPTQFTPYYVPPGAKSYDSSSPFVHYSGKWIDSISPLYTHKTLRSSSQSGSSIRFTFTGTGIEWFGNMDKFHGISQVYVDGKQIQEVDAWNPVKMRQQRLFWTFGLPEGKHTLKIVNTGRKREASNGNLLDIDALVVTLGTKARREIGNRTAPKTLSQKNTDHSSSSPASWTLTQKGTTGVHAMQLAIVSATHALIIDKVEHNPLTIDGHPAWAALYNLDTQGVRPIRMQSNSFCAGGTFLSNGTMVNVGGNPVVGSHTSAADFGDLDGLQAVRIFLPCDSDTGDGCEIYEDHTRIRLASPRWYNTVIRIPDGSAMIIGGSKRGGWINNGTVNNPTIEYFPPKSIHNSNGLPITLPFLVDTLNSNLFPIAFVLPDGKVFMAANQDAMIYDWRTNTEHRLPQIPNGVRVTYPMAGTALLLPLDPDHDYTPEVLLCGGSTVDDTKPGYQISSQAPASAQCSRIVLTEKGIAAGWKVEQMPQARTMPDAVLLPTGEVVIVNGAATGISGYGNVLNQVGASNADNPVLTPVLYNPDASAGHRFSSVGMPTSEIPRLYHSVATLTPNGDVMIAGSNPNLDRSEMMYGTEYRVEWLRPPYMTMDRPEVISGLPSILGFGDTVQLQVKLQTLRKAVSLMDLGFVTHAVHANSRLVYLAASLSLKDRKTLTITAPPDGNVYPPGPAFLYFVVDGVPSVGLKVLIGDGKGPEVDQAAADYMLANTVADQYQASKKKVKASDTSE